MEGDGSRGPAVSRPVTPTLGRPGGAHCIPEEEEAMRSVYYDSRRRKNEVCPLDPRRRSNEICPLDPRRRRAICPLHPRQADAGWVARSRVQPSRTPSLNECLVGACAMNALSCGGMMSSRSTCRLAIPSGQECLGSDALSEARGWGGGGGGDGAF